MTYQEKTNGQLKEFWQSIRGWLILIVFVLLMGDFSCMMNLPSYRVSPGTPEWELCVKDFSQAMRAFQDSVKADKVSLETNADLQIRIVSLLGRMEITGNQPEIIARKSIDMYVRNWRPDPSWPESLRKSLLADDNLRRVRVRTEFNSLWTYYQEAARMNYGNTRPLLADVSGLACLKWLLKWYYLLTLPAFLISLLYKRDNGSGIKEELILQYQRWSLAALAGPLGMAIMSEKAAKSYRYSLLLNEFHKEHPERWWPNPDEANALWRQVEQPLLSFDEAIASVRDGTVVRKPALVCLLVWLVSVQHGSASKSETASAAVFLTTSDGQEDCSAKASGSGHHPLLLAMLPQPFEEAMPIVTVTSFWTVGVEVKSTVRLTESPRGPPPADKEQHRTRMSLFLGCTMQKG